MSVPEDLEEKHEPNHSRSPGGRFVPTPGYDGRTSRQIKMCLASQGNHVVLSGIGGDGNYGGVPTPTQELEYLLARGQFGALAHKLKVWALEKRKPWFHCSGAAADFFLRARGVPKTCGLLRGCGPIL